MIASTSTTQLYGGVKSIFSSVFAHIHLSVHNDTKAQAISTYDGLIIICFSHGWLSFNHSELRLTGIVQDDRHEQFPIPIPPNQRLPNPPRIKLCAVAGSKSTRLAPRKRR